MIFDIINTTVEQFEEIFDTEKKARNFFEELRWGANPICPHCNSIKSYPNGCGVRYKCASCGKKYSVAVQSLITHTKAGLRNWLVGVFVYQKSRGRILTSALADILGVSDDTAFMMKDRLQLVFANIPESIKNEKSQVFRQAVMNFFTLKNAYLPKGKFSKNSYHIEGVLDISDPSTYDLLVLYARRRLLYCSHIYVQFITPEEALNEAFLKLSEYPELQRRDGQFIVKVINRVIAKLWYEFQKSSPKRYEWLLKYNKEWKTEARQKLKTYYLAQLETNRLGRLGAEAVSVSDVRSDLTAAQEIRDRILIKRGKRQIYYE